MDRSKIDHIINEAINMFLVDLYALKITEKAVMQDAKKSVDKITEWIKMVLNPE